MKILMVVAAAEDSEAGHTVRVPFEKLLFRAILAYPKIGPQNAIKRNDRAMEQQFIMFILFLKSWVSWQEENLLHDMRSYRRRRLYRCTVSYTVVPSKQHI